MVADEGIQTDLLVLGAGPGGYAAAFRAADLGLKVTLVDEQANPGGVCLYVGCIPSKALLHVARLLEESAEAANWGIRFQHDLDLARLRSWKESVVQKLTGGLGVLAKARKVRYVQGRGQFVDAHTLQVRTAEGETTSIRFEHAIVATGSRPVKLPLFPDSPRVWDSTDALALPEVPQRLLVVGGGYIGAELATVYAALGSRVTIVEMMEGLIPGVDRDLVRYLEQRMKRRLEGLLLKTRVARAEEGADGISVWFEGQSEAAVFDRVLVAVGRVPNSQGFGLEHTRVQVNPQGFIEVDAQRRTAEPNIFAIGDVAGQPMLAHKATAEAKVAAEVIAGRNVTFDPLAIPAVVFTDPEIAWCGLTETEAQAKGKAVKVGRFPWAASGRATTLGRSDGLTKVITDAETRQVLGVAIVGPGAGELIAEGVLAVEMGAVAEDLALSIHPHPTLSETIMEAAEAIYGPSTHFMGR